VASDSRNVSRETSPVGLPSIPPEMEPEPLSAAAVFGVHLVATRQLALDLALYSDVLGLLGPVELERLWTRHLINSAVVAPYLSAGARVADVGSGAGLPGLVLAILRPDVVFTLIEPMERRAEWLVAETARLGLGNVVVLRARAEEAVDSGPFDQVTARAVSALSKLIVMTAPLLREGGEMLFLKGARVSEEVTAATVVMNRHGVSHHEILVLGGGAPSEATRLFRATVGVAS
jgi:16S rRNA (guanine527-N7)-methyltransferase